MVSHRLAPPGGYFLTALANADSSSFVKGWLARAALAFRAFSASASLARCFSRSASVCCVDFPSRTCWTRSWTSCRASTLRAFVPFLPSSGRASEPPRRSANSVNCMAVKCSHKNSTSSCMASMFFQIDVLCSAAAAMHSFRNNCLALRNVFFSLSFCALAVALACFSAASLSAASFSTLVRSFSFSWRSSSCALRRSSAKRYFSSCCLCFSRIKRGSDAMARSTRVLIRLTSSRFQERARLSISF
mmetsp:Transcript_23429/g.54424  ORF Transcript_23429/g.54424 Transcript_23429/m.54424 type:complete len:246 (-) Transcript_23429:813-1550(-)